MTSSRLAPCFTADCAWNAMEGSHLVATEIARAINSLVLISSAFGSKAARAKAANSFMTFGVPARSSLTAVDISVVIPSQFLFMVSLFSSGDCQGGAEGGGGARAPG